MALLGQYPGARSEAVALEALRNEGAHRSIRAAAVRALAQWDLDGRTDLRAPVTEALWSDDVPIAVAAADALKDVPAAKSDLQKRLQSTPPPPVAKALRGD